MIKQMNEYINFFNWDAIENMAHLNENEFGDWFI